MFTMKHLQRTQKYMKTYFQTVLFANECHGTLDGPDGVLGVWVWYNGGGRWWDFLKAPKGVKITSAKHVPFLTAMVKSEELNLQLISGCSLIP